MLLTMSELFASFWRAAAYCLHPRVIWLSVLPLLLSGVLMVALGYFFWEGALDAVRARLDSWSLTGGSLDWLASVGLGGIRALLAPAIVVALAVPVLVVFSLLVVALLMLPRLVNLVAERRFPELVRLRGEPLWRSMLASAGATLAALGALLISIPLWFIPPLVLLLPPLIWGWLSYRVFAFDALADHASHDERREVMAEHRWPLLGIGIVTGYLGAAPALIWAVSAAALPFAPLLIVLSVWLYTLVFAFSALWFIHYALNALSALRAQRAPGSVPAIPDPVPLTQSADPPVS